MKPIFRKLRGCPDFVIPLKKISTAKHKKILFIVNIHGDEPIGQHILKLLIKKYGEDRFDWIIANPEATTRNVRFIDCDLNRSGPGDALSAMKEARLAVELTKLVGQYKTCIDIHQTRANNRTVLITPKFDDSIRQLASEISVRDVLIWETKEESVHKPIIYFAKNSIGFEVGTKNSFKRKVIQSVNVLSKFIDNIPNQTAKRYFRVGSKIEESDLITGVPLIDFTLYPSVDNPRFIPLLFGRHNNLRGYKMQRIDSVI